jgi:lipoprotein-anchoring transpeptidase ErfK/SrfK
MSRCVLLFLILLTASLGVTAPAMAKVEIRVDLDGQRMTVIKNNEKALVWKISSGRSGFETPTGRFIVQRMDADHLSDEYDQAPMPYSIFFSRGLAIHGTYQGGLGRPASHGCVRLSIDHARELYGWVEQYGASIEIAGDAPAYGYRDEEPARARRASSPRRRYREIGDPLLGGDDFMRAR